LDKGYDAAASFINTSLLPTLDSILNSGSWMDPKSRLQEVVQSKEGFTPVYKVLSEEGPDHDKNFVVGVFVNNKLKGEGNGPSKQAAQVGAASNALSSYQ